MDPPEFNSLSLLITASPPFPPGSSLSPFKRLCFLVQCESFEIVFVRNLVFRHHECRVKGFDGPEQFPGHVRNTSLGLSTASREGERNLNILGVTNCAFFQQNSSSLFTCSSVCPFHNSGQEAQEAKIKKARGPIITN